ncbi:hypothetical protein [Streptomyces sp. NPDC057199]|uniref:hypothetical protein n=1 Tax=Streptomyces sp. NPDC057199 TaxID=3346047 RepID=UPI00362C82BE
MTTVMPGAGDLPAEGAAAGTEAQPKGQWQWRPEAHDSVRVPATEWKLIDPADDAEFPPSGTASVVSSTRHSDTVPTDADRTVDGDDAYADSGPTTHAADDHGAVDRSNSSGSTPIFVDPSGRRAGRVRRMGWLVAAGCICSAATLGVAVTGGNSTAPWLHLPGMLGGDSQNRPTKVAEQPEQRGLGAPAADSPSSTAAGPPMRQQTETPPPDTRIGPRPDGNGTNTSSGKPLTAGTPSKAGGTEALPTGTAEAAAGEPSRSASPDTAQKPTTSPSSAEPGSPGTSPEASPSETSSTGLLNGLVNTVSDLFGK